MTEVRYKMMNGTAGAYGHGHWFLPEGKRPGKWMPKVTPVLCESGYHVCRSKYDLLYHLGSELYRVEVRGECISGDNTEAWEQARLLRRIETWNPRTQRLFAVDCARIAVNRCVLPRQRELLHACLDVVTASVEFGEEWDAARTAAEAAAEAAAWAAAEATAWAAAEAAAGCVAEAAAEAAARAAAWAAAWDEQAALLTRYLAGEQGPFVEEE